MKIDNDGNARRTMWAPEGLWARVRSRAKQEDRSVSSWVRARLEEALDDADSIFIDEKK